MDRLQISFLILSELNPLQPSVAFLYPLKNQKTFSFYDVFRKYRKATPGYNGLSEQNSFFLPSSPKSQKTIDFLVISKGIDVN